MNIKEHIEAEHYEKDAKGRALVEIGDLHDEGWRGGRATVLATDGATGEEIIARFPYARTAHWCATGRKSWPLSGPSDRAYVLLPPPPRTVPILRFLVRSPDGEWGPFKNFDAAELECTQRSDARIVSLRGEDLEAWS